MSTNREFPLELKHDNGHILIARDEMQASTFEKFGFKVVENKKKKK